MLSKIRKIREIDCERCGNTQRIYETLENMNTPFINKIEISSLNMNLDTIEEFNNTLYFCDDCWNELLDFLKRKGLKEDG